jgi:hypothetical protein
MTDKDPQFEAPNLPDLALPMPEFPSVDRQNRWTALIEANKTVGYGKPPVNLANKIVERAQAYYDFLSGNAPVEEDADPIFLSDEHDLDETLPAASVRDQLIEQNILIEGVLQYARDGVIEAYTRYQQNPAAAVAKNEALRILDRTREHYEREVS